MEGRLEPNDAYLVNSPLSPRAMDPAPGGGAAGHARRMELAFDAAPHDVPLLPAATSLRAYGAWL
jgi:hypothetical protein